MHRPARLPPLVLTWTCIYALASLLHFAHNALFAAAYPNLPGWVTPSVVVATWLAISAIGVLAWLALRAGARALGLGLLAVYACFGLDAFAHYRLAPLAAHSITMNLTICLEGASAIALLVALLMLGIRHVVRRAV